MMANDIYIFLVFPITVLCLYLYLGISRHYHWFDLPNEARKIHKLAKPTSAGLVFLLPIIVYIIVFPGVYSGNDYIILIILASLMVIGGIDDFKSIGVKFRLITLTLVSILLIQLLFKYSELGLFIALIYSIGLLWWLNLYNFMDGVDGLAALHGLATAFAYLISFILFSQTDFSITYVIAIFILSILAFLIFNFPNSKMFMGDAGSLSVAFILATFALFGLKNNIFDEIQVISFHLVFIIDATLTLFTRLKYKHKISQAHNLHYFQAQIAAGQSHAKVSTFYFLVTIIIVLMALLLQFYQVNITIRMMILISQTVILGFLWFNFHNKTKFERFKQ